MTAEELGFAVAEVEVIKDIFLDENTIISKGNIVTISSLNHPTDVKMWRNGQYQMSPEYFNIKKPINIVKKLKAKVSDLIDNKEL